MEATSSPTAPPTAGSGPAKPPRQRSAAYPSYTIESCIAFTQKVDTAFSSVNFTPQESISKTLEQSGGAFLMQLSSCVQYGLLDKSTGTGYKPSALFKKIARPLPDENVLEFRLECFRKPKLYNKLIEIYRNKQLPALAGLANTLDRLHGIVGVASVAAAKIFYKNVIALHLLSEDNILKMGAYIPFEEAKPDEPKGQDKPSDAIVVPPVDPSPPPKRLELPAPGTHEIPIVLKGKAAAKLILPDDFNDDDLRRVIKVLTAYVE